MLKNPPLRFNISPRRALRPNAAKTPSATPFFRKLTSFDEQNADSCADIMPNAMIINKLYEQMGIYCAAASHGLRLWLEAGT